jgi:hypothetical protein
MRRPITRAQQAYIRIMLRQQEYPLDRMSYAYRVFKDAGATDQMIRDGYQVDQWLDGLSGFQAGKVIQILKDEDEDD